MSTEQLGNASGNQLRPSRQDAEGRIKRYFDQVTKGCGQQQCDNEFCASGKLQSSPNKDEAAALALRLLLKGARLCPFQVQDKNGLSLSKLNDVIETCKNIDSFDSLVRLLGEAFSSSETLNHSFLKPVDDFPAFGAVLVNVQEIRESYDLLFGIGNQYIENALVNAFTSLGSIIEDSLRRKGDRKGNEYLNQLIIFFLNPNLQGPEYTTSALPAIMKATSYLPVYLQVTLIKIWSSIGVEHLKYIVDVLNQFITLEILTKSSSTGHLFHEDNSIVAAAKCMKLVFLASIFGGKFEQSRGLGIASNITSSSIYSTDELTSELNLDILSCREPLIACDDFVNEILNEQMDMSRDFTNYKYGEPKFSFLNYPFLLNAANKSLGLYYDNRVRMYSERRLTALMALMQGDFESFNSPYLRLKVRRDHLIEDALVRLEIISRDNVADLKKQLIVEFEGEQGVDEGGVSKEFFQLIVEQIFNPDYGMFIYNEARRQYWFNPTSFENDAQFTLIGLVFGLAIYNGIILDVSFPLVLYRKLLGRKGCFEDLEFSHEEIYKGLVEMLQYTGSIEEDFMVSFAVGYQNIFGEKISHELVEGGMEKLVNQENKEEFIERYSSFLLNDSIKAQFEAFKRGFDMVTEDSMLHRLFRPEELELLLCGSKTFDVEDLERSTEYDGGYSKDHPLIRYFWEIFHGMTIDEQRLLVAFTTGSDRVPVGGLAKLRLIIAKNGPDSDRLPTAHTCFNVLMLPEYSSKAKLQDRLLKAITHAKGFGLI